MGGRSGDRSGEGTGRDLRLDPKNRCSSGNGQRCLAGVLSAVVGAIVGVTGSRLVQYVVLGVVVGTALALIAVPHSRKGSVRPARVAIAGDSAIGDSLPRSHPTFATWSNVLMLAVIFVFAVYGAMAGGGARSGTEEPLVFGVIGLGLMLGVGVPITVGVLILAVAATHSRPRQATERAAAGDYNQRLPVVQDDDLGALAASFNRMQAGLAERQRLQAAFGTYVDPTWQRGCLIRVTMSSPVSAAR